MNMPELTERQELILAAIREHARTYSVIPSLRQICAATGIRWPNAVHRDVVRLQMAGVLPVGKAAARRLAEQEKRRLAARRPRGLVLVGSATVVDEVAVWRALTGDPARRLGIAERVEAVRLGARRGWTDGEIADRLGIWTRSVVRIRMQHGIPAGVPCTRRTAVAA